VEGKTGGGIRLVVGRYDTRSIRRARASCPRSSAGQFERGGYLTQPPRRCLARGRRPKFERQMESSGAGDSDGRSHLCGSGRPNSCRGRESDLIASFRFPWHSTFAAGTPNAGGSRAIDRVDFGIPLRMGVAGPLPERACSSKTLNRAGPGARPIDSSKGSSKHLSNQRRIPNSQTEAPTGHHPPCVPWTCSGSSTGSVGRPLHPLPHRASDLHSPSTTGRDCRWPTRQHFPRSARRCGLLSLTGPPAWSSAPTRRRRTLVRPLLEARPRFLSVGMEWTQSASSLPARRLSTFGDRVTLYPVPVSRFGVASRRRGSCRGRACPSNTSASARPARSGSGPVSLPGRRPVARPSDGPESRDGGQTWSTGCPRTPWRGSCWGRENDAWDRSVACGPGRIAGRGGRGAWRRPVKP